MRYSQAKQFNTDWEYEQAKKQQKKKHKAFREQRKNRNQWEGVDSE